jgi:Ubiquitinol-cytochrome C reductase Fe-S subunit TAT signal
MTTSTTTIESNRRDFLHQLAAGGVGALGAAVALQTVDGAGADADVRPHDQRSDGPARQHMISGSNPASIVRQEYIAQARAWTRLDALFQQVAEAMGRDVATALDREVLALTRAVRQEAIARLLLAADGLMSG